VIFQLGHRNDPCPCGSGKKYKNCHGRCDGMGSMLCGVTQFKGKPKEAIKFLREQQKGECIASLHRDDIGDIDIVWGKFDLRKKPR
jgi:hypothetical protein